MAHYLLPSCHETHDIHNNTPSAPLPAQGAENTYTDIERSNRNGAPGILLKQLPPVMLSELLTGTGVRSEPNSYRA